MISLVRPASAIRSAPRIVASFSTTQRLARAVAAPDLSVEPRASLPPVGRAVPLDSLRFAKKRQDVYQLPVDDEEVSRLSQYC
jgi:hypothetical protein